MTQAACDKGVGSMLLVGGREEKVLKACVIWGKDGWKEGGRKGKEERTVDELREGKDGRLKEGGGKENRNDGKRGGRKEGGGR